MNEVSVYRQLTAGTNEIFDVLKREIGMKTTCAPFAVKLMQAMKSLYIKTEQDAITAANTILSGLQTLSQGGITAEDYDKIDFIKRENVIVPSARVEAFLRAAARKGYRITDTIIPVPKEDGNTTYFKENFFDGEIVYTLEDGRKNLDREVTAKRLTEGYFERFICRLEVYDVVQNRRITVSVCEMTPAEILAVAAASEQGIYKSEWQKYINDYGQPKKKKVTTGELNTGTIWYKWTGEMVNKTIIRRALKRVKEVLPELTDAIYAFEKDEYREQTEQPKKDDIVINIPVKSEDVDLKKLTDEQKNEAAEVREIFKANPKVAIDEAHRIKEMFESGMTRQEIINAEYASIYALKGSKIWKSELEGHFNEKN